VSLCFLRRARLRVPTVQRQPLRFAVVCAKKPDPHRRTIFGSRRAFAPYRKRNRSS
jgi:hypothetical protein